ncbi:hypothetical protein FRC03_005664 [Tulasnella sp. 419]|nr:hypothetical protein FRC03_005664 [Tulasnella sp. 419]
MPSSSPREHRVAKHKKDRVQQISHPSHTKQHHVHFALPSPHSTNASRYPPITIQHHRPPQPVVYVPQPVVHAPVMYPRPHPAPHPPFHAQVVPVTMLPQVVHLHTPVGYVVPTQPFIHRRYCTYTVLQCYT